MEEKDVIDVLRLYRHDLMNDLQIVQGYLMMRKMDRVEDKLAACMAHYNEERKLISLNAPKFALWLIQFNSIHGTFRLTYDINTENINLQGLDSILLRNCQHCIELIEKAANDTELYEGNIRLNYENDSSTIHVQLSMIGSFKKVNYIDPNEKDQKIDIHIQQEDDGIMCEITIPCN